MVLLGLCVGLWSGCRDQGGETIEDPLILELGGDSPTIDEVLDKTSRRRAQPESPPATGDPVATEPRPFPVEPRERIVKLPEGWNLAKLCAHELGDESRWPEVAELNEWDEDQLRQLTPGTEVRLPYE